MSREGVRKEAERRKDIGPIERLWKSDTSIASDEFVIKVFIGFYMGDRAVYQGRHRFLGL
jgi:hypothetical protein